MIERVYFSDDSELGFWASWGPDWHDRWSWAWQRVGAAVPEVKPFSGLTTESRAELLRMAQEDSGAKGLAIALITDANFDFERHHQPSLGGARLAREFVSVAGGSRAIVYSAEPKGNGDETDRIWLFTARRDGTSRSSEMDVLVEFLHCGRRLEVKCLRALLEEVVVVGAALGRALKRRRVDPDADIFMRLGILGSIKSGIDGCGPGSGMRLFEPRTRELLSTSLERVLPMTVFGNERLISLRASLDPCESLSQATRWVRESQGSSSASRNDLGALRLIWELVRIEGDLERTAEPTKSERDPQLSSRVRGVLRACRRELASLNVTTRDPSWAGRLLEAAKRESELIVATVERWRDFESRESRRAALSHSVIPDLLQRLGATDEFFTQERDSQRRDAQLRNALLTLSDPPHANVFMACKSWRGGKDSEGVRSRLRSVIADGVLGESAIATDLGRLDNWLGSLDAVLEDVSRFVRLPELPRSEVAASFAIAARELLDRLRSLSAPSTK